MKRKFWRIVILYQIIDPFSNPVRVDALAVEKYEITSIQLARTPSIGRRIVFILKQSIPSPSLFRKQLYSRLLCWQAVHSSASCASEFGDHCIFHAASVSFLESVLSSVLSTMLSHQHSSWLWTKGVLAAHLLALDKSVFIVLDILDHIYICRKITLTLLATQRSSMS